MLAPIAAPIVASIADEYAAMAEAAARIRSEFVRWDTSGDSQIDANEFRAAVTDPLVGQRDFQIFDFDVNGRLSRAEFACVSGLGFEPHLRGTVPDPVVDLVDDAVAALDQSYDHWDQRPDELVSAHSFVSNFLDSISPGKKRFVTGRIVNQADGNSDGRISRTEARHFLEQQLGYRLQRGSPLREPTGRVVRFDNFLDMDHDHDGTISRDEFVAGWSEPSVAQEQFVLIDGDGNGRISYEEYAHPHSPTYFDSIIWFRSADTDLNGRLGEKELEMAVELSRRHLASSAIRSFDDDRDGELSLFEYRRSMLGSFNYPWDHRPLDQDRNGRLSFDEFVFGDVDLFQLQRWYFYHRLDINQDGGLSRDEFEFRSLEPLSIRAYSTQDHRSKLVYRNPDYPDCGWPSISPDGTQILIHESPPERPAQGRIVLISFDQKHVRILCDGLQPSWSADGEQFVCERRSSKDPGIWILDASGRQGRRVAQGRSPKWSPDGKRIAFLNENGVSILDLETDAIHELFLREDHPYQDLGSDIAWSPDSQRLAVLGNFAATSQLLILATDLAKTGLPRIRYSFDVPCNSNLNWSDQNGIVMAIRDPKSMSTQLISLSADSDREPTGVGQFAQEPGVRSACLTPDGQWYITVVEE